MVVVGRQSLGCKDGQWWRGGWEREELPRLLCGCSSVTADRAISRKQARAELFPHNQNLSPSLETSFSDLVVLRYF